jgi:predicted permease
MLGVSAIRGRVFLDEEDRVDQAPALALISESLWRRRFGGEFGRDQAIELNGKAWTVVGVLPGAFTGLEPQIAPDVWVTTAGWARLTSARDLVERDYNWFDIVARLSPGATTEQAQQETDAFVRHLAETFPQLGRERGAVVMPLMEARGRGTARLRVLLLGIVGLVLLIACANVAALLTSRAQARQRELGIRAALGGARGRLFRQLLVENALLAALSGVAALVLAAWIIRLLPSLLPPSPLPLGYQFVLDTRVVLFTLGVSLLTVVIFGILPAAMASRPDVLSLLRSGTRTSGASRRRAMARHLLVAGQFAASLVLVAAAGLFVQSLWRLGQTDAGFAHRPLVIVTVAPGVAGYEGARVADLAQRLVGRVTVAPGVEQASAARRMPLSPFGGGATERVVIPGQDPPQGQDAWTIKATAVGPGYFATIGTRLLRGRDFTDADRVGTPGVVVISRAMADRFWPGADPIGQQILLGSQKASHEIIGIAQDVKINNLREAAQPYFYRAYYQRPSGDLTVVARTKTDDRGAAPAVREAIRAAEPRLPMLQVMTLEDHLRAATFETHMQAVLVGVMGAVGLLLAVVGLFGVVTYLVGCRAQEFGVRLALGASPGMILRGVLRQGLLMALSGAIVGVVGALAAGRALAGLFYEVSPADPLTLFGSVLLLALVALAASYVPARRASRIDPVAALKSE